MQDWKIWPVSLSIKPITISHTAENIKSEVTEVLGYYNIVPQCFVADNASNQVVFLMKISILLLLLILL
jgi:hypothetical protein